MSRSYEDDEIALFPPWLAVTMVGGCLLVLAVLVVLLLTFGRSVGTEVGRETRTYRVVGVKSPKHFQVDLQDTGTGEVSRSLAVSKHCNRWRELAIGTEVQLEWVTMQPRNHEPRYYRIVVSPGKLCPGYDG